MNLGIRGRTALVLASSRGLGYACAHALAMEGCAVVLNGRSERNLIEASLAIAASSGITPRHVVADLTSHAGREALLAACPSPDILITNNQGPAPGALKDWDHAALVTALEANMLAPALMIRSVLPGMRERGFGRIVNITSAMVKSPRPHHGLSTSARTALTAFCKALAPDAARDNVTINNLLPERFDTDRQAQMFARVSALENISVDEARQRATSAIPAGRMGRPEEFGACCAFLCSELAGFVTAQNLQLDGGAYAALF